MNNISVPSRFSCLKIEDEEFHPVTHRSSKKKLEIAATNNKPTVKKIIAEKTNSKKPSLIGKHNSVSTNNSSTKTSKKSKSKGKQEDKQWEEWKQKDDQFVNENFEQDMQCAILQSKLDFENQKKNSVSVIITSQEKNKKKKSKTMSLDQFLEGSTQDSNKVLDKENKTNSEDDSNFFEKVINSAKQELKREKVEEKRRERNSNIEEVITLVQYQEKLQKQLEINEQLKKELEDAKKEISIVKSRNKTLCSMLSQGEMKDKAAVLLELEKLTTVKEELTEEVTRLHKLLEQERSSTKANCITATESHSSKHKEKNKVKKKH